MTDDTVEKVADPVLPCDLRVTVSDDSISGVCFNAGVSMATVQAAVQRWYRKAANADSAAREAHNAGLREAAVIADAEGQRYAKEVEDARKNKDPAMRRYAVEMIKLSLARSTACGKILAAILAKVKP